jgi:transposase
VHLQTVKADIARHPQSVKTVVAKLEEELDVAMHPDTLKRFLKSWLPLLSLPQEPQVAAGGRGKS